MEACGLKALGADLPPDLDRHLKRLIDSATKGTSKGEGINKPLLVAFAAGTYTAADFETVLRALDTSTTGSTPQSKPFRKDCTAMTSHKLFRLANACVGVGALAAPRSISMI